MFDADRNPSTATQPLPRIEASLLITDLDNTLWDWFEIWYRSFSALLAGIVRISGVPQLDLEREIRRIHQLRGTAEYSYLIQELPVLRDLHGSGADLKRIYRDAIQASRDARRGVLRLYPDALETLTTVHDRGTIIAGYTESLAFQTTARVKHLGLDGVVDFLYSPPDHDFPVGVTRDSLRTMGAGSYELKRTEHRYTPRGVLKPSADVLRQIVAELRDSRRAIYVGDSLMKDVAMAQAANVTDVWASYGVVHDLEKYALLQRVTHWTDADVEREKQVLRHPDIRPSFTLHRSLGELLTHFEFVRNGRR